MTELTYGELDLFELLDGDWSCFGMFHEHRSDGIHLLAKPTNLRREFDASELAWPEHTTGRLEEPALPFPFTLAQFLAFCRTRPDFRWFVVEARYTNDMPKGAKGCSFLPDCAGLAELAGRSPRAALLVIEVLWPEDGAERSAALMALPREVLSMLLSGQEVEQQGDVVAGRLPGESAPTHQDRLMRYVLRCIGHTDAAVPLVGGGHLYDLRTRAIAEAIRRFPKVFTTTTAPKAWQRLPKKKV